MDERLRNAIADPNVLFFAIPTEQFKELILHSNSPIIRKLPKWVRKNFLAGKVYPLSNQMVLDYINGTLDARNTFILDHCELRVAGAAEILLKKPDLTQPKGSQIEIP